MNVKSTRNRISGYRCLKKKFMEFRGSLHIHTNVLRTFVLLFWHNSKVYQGIFVIGYNIFLFTAIAFERIVKAIMTHYRNCSVGTQN